MDIDKLLESEVGDYPRIRAFRENLTQSERELFDKIFLLGFREGLLVKLGNPGFSEYVRVAPTTFYKKPQCFGEFVENIRLARSPKTVCNFCPVKKQCEEDNNG